MVRLFIQAGQKGVFEYCHNEPVNHVILEDIDRNTTIDAVIGRLIDGGMLRPINNNTNNTSQITCSLRSRHGRAPLRGTSTLEDNNITDNTVLIVTCFRQCGGYKYKKAKRKTKRKAKRKTRIRRISKKLKTKRISRGRKLRRRKTH